MSDEVKELERKLAEARKKAQQKIDDEEDVEQEIDEEEPTQKNEDDVHDEEDESPMQPRQKQMAKKAMKPKTLTPKKPTMDDKVKASAKKKPRGRPPTGENGEPKQWNDALGDWVEGKKRSNDVVRRRTTKRQRVEEAVVDVDEDWRTMMWMAVKKAVKPYVAEIVREVLNE